MEAQTKINTWGNSLAIRITSAMAKAADLHKGSEVSVEANEEGIFIKPLYKKAFLKYSEKELLADISAESAATDLLATNTVNELTY